MNFNTPELEPKITKDFLLEKNTAETYMSTYLGISISKSLVRNPLRNDKRPTASFHRNSSGELIFHDFGTGFHENFIGVVMTKFSLSYNEALHKIAADFGYIKSNNTPIKIKISDTIITEKKETCIQIAPREFTEKELFWWNKYGISQNTLNKYKIFACKDIFLNNNYFTSSTENNPIFGYYCGKKNGNELWRIYFPKKQTFRFLSNTPKSYIQGAKQIPENGKLLVITKSMKDCAALYELGISAIAPCSEVLFISKCQLQALQKRFEKIIVFYDNDLPGIQSMRHIKKEYPELQFFWIPRKYEAKDVSDFIKKYGIDQTKKYIEELKTYYEIN